MNAAQSFPTKSELEALMREKKVPGLSLVIIENAEITMHKELGLKNTQKKKILSMRIQYLKLLLLANQFLHMQF